MITVSRGVALHHKCPTCKQTHGKDCVTFSLRRVRTTKYIHKARRERALKVKDMRSPTIQDPPKPPNSFTKEESTAAVAAAIDRRLGRLGDPE